MPPRKKHRDDDTPMARVEGLYESILATLKPERDLTAGEFMKRAFTFPQIDRIMVQKYAAGTWNFAEHLDSMTSGFDPLAIEAYLGAKYGAWRFRLMAVANGEVICHHVLNLDGWQVNEERSAANLPSKTVLTPGVRPVNGASLGDLMRSAQERVEIENATRLLRGLEKQEVQTRVETDMAPMKMMAEMMASAMAMMKEAITLRAPAAVSTPDPLTAYLLEEVRFLREQSTKPERERDVGALTKTVESIDAILQKALGTNLAEVIGGAKPPEQSGWAGVVSGVIEGVKPHLGEIMGFLQRQAPAGPRYPRPATVTQFPAPDASRQPVLQVATPPPSSTPEEGAMPKLDPVYVEVINILIDALRSKNWDAVDAAVMNPPLRGQIILNPNVSAKQYAVQLSVVDPRFRELEPEIGEYLKHMAEQIAAAEEDDE